MECMTSKNPAFLFFSTHRAGTTLMREILNSHDSIYCSEEMHHFGNLIELSEWARNICNTEITSDIIEINSRFIETHKPIKGFQCIGELNAPYVIDIYNFYNRPKVIFLKRDPRDIYLSWLRTGIFENSWYYLKEIHDKMIQFAIDYFCIKYEELCLNPTAVWNAVLDYLGLEWTEENNGRMLQVLARGYSLNETPAFSYPDMKVVENVARRWPNINMKISWESIRFNGVSIEEAADELGY